MPSPLAVSLVTSALVATAGIAPAAPSEDGLSCSFRITAKHVLAELTGDTSQRAEEMRDMLVSVGADRSDFVPAECSKDTLGGSGAGTGGDSGSGAGTGGDSGSGAGTGGDSGSGAGTGGDSGSGAGTGGDSGSGAGTGGDSGSGAGTGGDSGSGAGTGGDSGSSAGTGGDSGSSAGTGGDSGSSAGTGQGQTAADAFGWGEPAKVDDFESDLTGWSMYDGPGHGGNGVRSPDAASVSDGILTINGSGDGTTAGMAWGDAQKYGRWEVRMKAPKGSPSYNALALLWPAAENFPVGGEVDFAEIMDSDRKKVEMFLHYGEDNSQVHGEVEVDATEWHNYAVEWTPDSITTFLDGEEWWKTTDTSILPPGPMHLCLQLDWFPKGDSEAGEVNYDWVKQWPMNESDQASTQSAGSDGSTDSDSSTSLTDEENNWGSQGDSSSDGGDDS